MTTTRIPRHPHRSTRLHAALLSLAAAALPVAAAGADGASTLLTSTYGISGSLGLVLPGTISVSAGGTAEFDTDTGLLLQGAADYYVVPKLAVGLYLAYQRVGVKNTSETASVVGVGPTIKARFGIGEKLALRPSLSIGYQHGSWTGTAPTTTGLGIGLQLEGAFPLGAGVNGLVQLGFSTQPTGGNADIDLTWGPIFYLAVGAEFGQ